MPEDPASGSASQGDFFLTLLLIWGPVAYKLFLLLGGRLPSLEPTELYQIGLVLDVLFIWGCCRYARSKGYSGWWGLTGFLFYVGALIIFFLPRKRP